MRSLTVSLMSAVGSCAAMDRRLADITRGPAPPGNQRETKMESQRHGRAGAERPRPRMARAFIRVPMEQTVTRQRIAMVAIDLLKRDHNLWQRCTEHGERREEMAMNTHLSKRMTMVA